MPKPSSSLLHLRSPNPSIERTFQRPLRALWPASHVKRWATTMPLTRFAMLVKTPGYDPEIHKVVLSSPSFSTSVVCVSDFGQALSTVIVLVQGGV